MPHDAFISYASSDKSIADAVCAGMEARRIRCWIAPRDVLPGRPYAEALADAIDASGVLILVFSSDANVSPQVMREVERAVHNGIPIVPFRIEDVEPTKAMSYFVEGLHWLDALTPPLERHIDYLVATTKQLLARPDDQPEKAAVPYVSHNKAVHRRRLSITHLAIAAAISVALGAAVFYGLRTLQKPAEIHQITIAGKKFLESSILLEVFAQMIEADNPGIEVSRLHYFGDSANLFVSLRDNQIDLYPEYTGTLLAQHLYESVDSFQDREHHDVHWINERLGADPTTHGLVMLSHLGFDNPFVLVMSRDKAEHLGIIGENRSPTVSDLAEHSQTLRFSGSASFATRADGRGFLDAYGLKFKEAPREISHEYKYGALKENQIDITDGYGTDPELSREDLVKVRDDKGFFPPYFAAPIGRKTVLVKPVAASLEKLAGKLSLQDMIALIREAGTLGLRSADLATDEEARNSIRSMVEHYLERRQFISSDTTSDIKITSPKQGSTHLGVLLYQWTSPPDVAAGVTYQIERRSGEGGDSSVWKVSRLAFPEDELTGRIQWRVRALAPDGQLGGWTAWHDVSFYRTRWDRILATRTLHVGIGKADDLFVRDAPELGGPEILLLQELVHSLFRREERAGQVELIGINAEWDEGYFDLLLENPDVDLLVSRISITSKRESGHNIKFTRPTISYPQAFLIRENVDVVVDGRIDLSALGAQAKTTNADLALQILERKREGVEKVDGRNASARCKKTPCLMLWSGHFSDLGELTALRDGKIDAIVADQPYAYHLRDYAERQGLGMGLRVVDITPELFPGAELERIGFAVRPSDTVLLEKLNSAISANPQLLKEFRQSVGAK